MWRKWWWGVDEKTIRAPISDHLRFDRHRFLILAFVIVAPGVDARASTAVATQGPEAKAVSMGRGTFSLAFEAIGDESRTARWRCDAGEWTLFDVEGLAVGACAAEVRSGGWGGVLSLGILSSPVGNESVLEGSVIAAGRRRVGLAGGARLETIALDGCRKAAQLSLSIDAVCRFSPVVAMITRVEGIRVGGAPRPGADARVCVVAFPAGSLCGIVGISVSRSGDVVCDASSRVRVGRRVRAAVGYDDASAAINGSFSVKVRALVFEFGASVHPVLGVSKALFVSWTKGWWE